jgi:hypothetical protein
MYEGGVKSREGELAELRVMIAGCEERIQAVAGEDNEKARLVRECAGRQVELLQARIGVTEQMVRLDRLIVIEFKRFVVRRMEVERREVGPFPGMEREAAAEMERMRAWAEKDEVVEEERE